MALHMRKYADFRNVWLRQEAVGLDGRTGNVLLWALALAIMASGAIIAGWPSPATAPSLAVQQAVVASLTEARPNAPDRLVHASVTARGDLRIEFILREPGGAEANRAAALADALAVARAVYQTPATPRPLNLTLLGVSAAGVGPSPLSVLYASLPADRLVGLDWTRVQAEDLATLAVVRWLPAGLCHAWHDCRAIRG
jgi:hypothetical protein